MMLWGIPTLGFSAGSATWGQAMQGYAAASVPMIPIQIGIGTASYRRHLYYPYPKKMSELGIQIPLCQLRYKVVVKILIGVFKVKAQNGLIATNPGSSPKESLGILFILRGAKVFLPKDRISLGG